MEITIHTNDHEETMKLFDLCMVSKLSSYSFVKDGHNAIKLKLKNSSERYALTNVIEFADKYIIQENNNE